MIRDAGVDDIPAIMEMGKAFADDAGVTAAVGWCDESVRHLLKVMIESPDGILLVDDKVTGMIGGVVHAHPFNQQCRVFVEMFWRSYGGQGVRLLKAAEKAAATRGATRCVMIAMQGMQSATKFYERAGYTPLEQQFVKEIDDGSR